MFLVYCRELAPGTVCLTGDRAQGNDSKHDSHYRRDKNLLLKKNIMIDIVSSNYDNVSDCSQSRYERAVNCLLSIQIQRLRRMAIN